MIQASPLYETEPWGDADQPFYVNQVVALAVTSAWTPHKLLAATQAIEAGQGRVRDPNRHFGPRTLDVDLLLFGRERLAQPELTIPHPRLRQRAFVLVPLADMAPDLVIPDEQGGTVRQALAKIEFTITDKTIITGA